MLDLANILKKEIHPVILNYAGEELMRQIFIHGNCILVKDQRKLSLFKMTTFARMADIGYYRTGCNQASGEAWWRIESLVDPNLILAKAGSAKHHLSRVIEKRDVDLNGFIEDIDRQEIVLFNIQAKDCPVKFRQAGGSLSRLKTNLSVVSCKSSVDLSLQQTTND